ncbi:MAG: MBL fold metallo-hydrolase [Armatimonadetes bacterium]|nr:MBL fold metallo-hydrolase [Armatimonadota bacterium]
MQRQIAFCLAGAAACAGLLVWLRPAASQVNTVKELTSGVYFHEGDLAASGHCNNGWIVFDDYVVVVDGNFPSGARVIIPKIRSLTRKPIRFAFDTHHHGDHAYGNQVWVDEGAIPVAHTGVLDEMKKYETGHFGRSPGRWEEAAKTREDVRTSRLKPPTLLFPDRMIFDDGKKRLELRWFGVAHTHGDGWAWMPGERILFSGDACVNGPYNYVGDGSIASWIETLEKAKALKPLRVVPGHGPVGDSTLLDDQQLYFKELRRQGQALFARHRNPAEALQQVAQIRQEVEKDGRIKRYVGNFFADQIGKAYQEAGGQPFPMRAASADCSHGTHAAMHGASLAKLGAPLKWRKGSASPSARGRGR